MTTRFPAERAFARASELPVSKWPGRKGENRLEPICIPAVVPSFRIPAGAEIFTIGSCFARNIEEYFDRMGFVIPTLNFVVPKSEWRGGRPNGILNKYTPPSIFREIEWAASIHERVDLKEADLAGDLIETGAGQWIDLQLGGFIPVSRDRAISRRRELAAIWSRCFAADFVTITLGLVECWWDSETERYIQQTPTPELLKKYPGRFEFELMSYEKCLGLVRASIDLVMKRGNPNKKILMTTSPVPLARSFSGMDAIVANTYAKSVLRAVSGAIAEEYGCVDYFPSYEMVALSKDASIWHDDLIHVEDGFVYRIVRHLVDNYVEGTVADVPMITGMLQPVEGNIIRGYAFDRQAPTVPVEVTIRVNDRDQVVVARDPRPILKARGMHETGNCGFELRIADDQPLKIGDKVSALVGEGTDLSHLVGSPFTVEKI